jgi:hypothetical protein
MSGPASAMLPTKQAPRPHMPNPRREQRTCAPEPVLSAAHAQPPARATDILPNCPLPGPSTGHAPGSPARRPSPNVSPERTRPILGTITGHLPRSPARAQHIPNPPTRATDIYPNCPLPSPSTGHVPRISRPQAKPERQPGAHPPNPRHHHWTSPPEPGPSAAHAQPPTRATDIYPSRPILGAITGHVPRGPSTTSAFMLFFIDKPTRTKIKSNNSTSCDGSH